MRLTDCYQLGEVIKTHGLRGEISVRLDVDFPEDYQNMESVFLNQEGRLIPFFVDTIQINGSKALVKLEDCDSQDRAKELLGTSLYLPVSRLPKLPERQFYYHDLVGCTVFEAEKEIGNVVEIYDLPQNELMTVNAKGREVLIPIKDEILIQVDLDTQKIIVDLPDGLLNL